MLLLVGRMPLWANLIGTLRAELRMCGGYEGWRFGDGSIQ